MHTSSILSHGARSSVRRGPLPKSLRRSSSKPRKHHFDWAKRDAACSNFYWPWEAGRELLHVWALLHPELVKFRTQSSSIFIFFFQLQYPTTIADSFSKILEQNRGENWLSVPEKIVMEKVAKRPRVAFPLKGSYPKFTTPTLCCWNSPRDIHCISKW